MSCIVANEHCLKQLLKDLYDVFTLENYQKHCMLLKKSFEIPYFLSKEVCEQTAAFIYYKYGYSSHGQVLSCGHICC